VCLIIGPLYLKEPRELPQKFSPSLFLSPFEKKKKEKRVFKRMGTPPLLAWLTGFPHALGPTNPCTNAVDMEPFSNFGLQARIFLL